MSSSGKGTKRSIINEIASSVSKRVHGKPSASGSLKQLLTPPPGFAYVKHEASLIPQGMALNERGVPVPYIDLDDCEDSDDVSDEDIIIPNVAAESSAGKGVNGTIQAHKLPLSSTPLKITFGSAQSSQPEPARCSSSIDRRIVVTSGKSPVTEAMQGNFDELKVISKHIHLLSENIIAGTSHAFQLSTDLNKTSTTLARLQTDVADDDKAYKEIDFEIKRLQRQRRKMASELNAKRSAMKGYEDKKKEKGEALSKILDAIEAAKNLITKNEARVHDLEATHRAGLAKLK